MTNDPTARHLVPEDQQTALACNAKVRARHGLLLAFFAKHPAEPYRSRVGFSKLQIGSPVRSFFCWHGSQVSSHPAVSDAPFQSFL